MKKIKIAGRTIGKGEPCFVIAEAGVNHNGKVNIAKNLIDAAKRAGADAVKFQAFEAEEVVTRTAAKAAYQKKSGKRETQYEMIKKLELPRDAFKRLAAHAKRKNIIFLASAFGNESVDLLAKLKVPAFKIPSGEITNTPFLKRIARERKPIIMSTGMSTIGEIEEALEAINSKSRRDIVLLHCVTDYPAQIEEMNLRNIQTLESAFGLPVGLSDHTLGITVPIAGVALGAVVVEKHFTLNKKLPGPDHQASLEPSEFGEMVKRIREIERALGDGLKKPAKSEEAIKKVVRRSIVARTDIPKGTAITENMLDLKRPGTGLGPGYLKKIVGKRAKRDIKTDELITFGKLRG